MDKMTKLNRSFSLYLSLVLIVLCIGAFTITSKAADSYWDSNTIPSTRQKDLLYDDAELLSASEQEDLTKRLNEVSNRWDCTIAILTVDTPINSIQDFADDYFDYNGMGADHNGNGILLVLNMDDRSYWFSTSGTAISAFTDYGLSKMFDKMSSDLGDNYYHDAFVTYTEVCDDYLEMYSKGTPYDVGVKQPKDVVKGLLLSFLAALLVALVPIFVMASHLKSVTAKHSAKGYQAHDGLHMRVHRDTYLRSHVTKTEIPRDNDRSGGFSGGSSTHMSSSGSTHGGGGGHF
ncbi:TPM domain-containing protein [Butyrivibrio proteoclasticus]|uniref:TPM domain-containing protein n=1 Tax=Butyrivibrio proteoclasticus TaxID=43305 RepID=UPI000685B424|nr:TPM domain-containing protein [Butyrivibrio proteoclasticus]